MTIHSEQDLPRTTRYLVAYRSNVYAITSTRVSLEEIIVQTVGEDGGL